MGGLIGLVIVLVATIVIAVFAAKHWHWAHVLLVVGLTFATVGYANLAYRILSERARFQEREAAAREELETYQELTRAVRHGTDDSETITRLRREIDLPADATRVEGVDELEHQLRLLNLVRGRSWPNVRAIGPPDQQTGRVEVGVPEDAPPLNINPGAILYAFEQGDPSAGAQYIGEFRVVEAQPRALLLEPVLAMRPEAVERYVQSASNGAAWVLHESMPVDRHEVFADLTEEQLREMLPASSVEEYVRHDTPFQEGQDDPLRRMGYNEQDQLVGPEEMDTAVREVYYRQLRDYAFLFQEFAERRKELLAQQAFVQNGIDKMQQANQSAQELLAQREADQQRLEADNEGVTRDQRAIESYVSVLGRQIDNAQRLLDQTLAANSRDARRLADAQAALLGVEDLSGRPTGSTAAGDPHGL